MIFRLGFVAMTLDLENCSPSGTVTYTTYKKLKDENAKRIRLARVSRSNLENTLRILKNNAAQNIEVYRITSKLIPLATHNELFGWNYSEEFQEEFRRIGEYIKANNFRVSAHPDHFTLLNSVKAEVLEASIRDLDYHVRIFEAMGLDDYRYKLVLHVGGVYGDKEQAIKRFKKNYLKLPDRIRKRIILENDDKAFTAADVLGICEDLNIPMVLDVHHHNCVNNGEEIEELLPRIFNTWNGEIYPPKLHFSSPKSNKEYRSHADYIDYSDFVSFLNKVKVINKDIDFILECKMKDRALLELSEKLKETEGIVQINKATFKI
ncbi:UV DNA damage repair endonuclease UvsE [Ruminiclostridium herbifermentans]|uniref:UV DNA damage repair endonuclease UvsE n=1 Tax=Ruminiclostridium herbifermentans TaxID=2488810 RepID=A0A4U7JFS3_9FIRM|nr:UV DNA damage repair endonuclease UvsE [Ruminiclostridium herbifermentans]QNU67555.1 UV DNA damage repair endonuclease UvsE [Ruminiclostridium herbifermentans]